MPKTEKSHSTPTERVQTGWETRRAAVDLRREGIRKLLAGEPLLGFEQLALRRFVEAATAAS